MACRVGLDPRPALFQRPAARPRGRFVVFFLFCVGRFWRREGSPLVSRYEYVNPSIVPDLQTSTVFNPCECLRSSGIFSNQIILTLNTVVLCVFDVLLLFVDLVDLVWVSELGMSQDFSIIHAIEIHNHTPYQHSLASKQLRWMKRYRIQNHPDVIEHSQENQRLSALLLSHYANAAPSQRWSSEQCSSDTQILRMSHSNWVTLRRNNANYVIFCRVPLPFSAPAGKR